MRPINLRFLLERFCPFLFCLFLILCSLLPFHFLPYYPYPVLWILIPIFYFAIYNPKYLGVGSVFVLGLLWESFVQSPLGVTSFCCVLLFFIANIFRKYFIEMTFVPLWIVFGVELLTVLLVEYGLVRLLSECPISFYPILVEFLILVLVYPFLMRFCAFISKRIRESV